ncbi:MAG: sensor domain-containing diguanylate cyclase [Thermodesulfovibrionales bacterium]
MGNTLQEILQRTGDKKRQGFWIRHSLLFALLFVTYLGLLLEFPLKSKGLWFIFSITTITVYSVFHIIKKEKRYSVEFLFSLALFMAGAAQAFSIPWLKMAYFPFLIFLTAFYGRRTILALLLTIPFLELGSFLKGALPVEVVIFIVSLSVTVGISLFLKNRIRKDNVFESSFREREAVSTSDSEEEIKSFGDEKVVSHYLESMFRPDDEIKDILMVAKKTLFADAVNLFTSSGGSLRLRSSTDESGAIIPSGSGLIDVCFHQRKPLISSDISEKKLEVGYLKRDKISSLVSVPVMDESFPLGVITADSARFQAFSSADKDILQMFSKQIVRILQRERVYPQIGRSYAKLEILNEESSKLLSSLNVDVIVQNLIDGAYRIAPSEIAFFMAKGDEFELIQQRGFQPQEKTVFVFKNTLLDNIVKDKKPYTLSDVRDYRTPIMPFKTDNTGSVVALPLLYEKDLLGIFALLSEKTNAFSPHQIELLKVLANQASTSIANARFHAEIERLAVTDGLTGLFNHRHFQERLAQEFNRLERFLDPISLLIIDIDHFKKINDTYGHPVGDSVLKGIAEKIRKTIRNIDVPARYGGEEFAVILPGTNENGAMNMAERLRKAMGTTKFASEKGAFSVTVSIGVSTFTKEIRSKEELVETADKALYHAKRNGRNRSVLWNEINGNLL